MSVERTETRAYGLFLTDDECRAGLRALGQPAGTDPSECDYVEEPFWDLAMALKMEFAVHCDDYDAACVRQYVIGPASVCDDGLPGITVEPEALGRLRAFRDAHFPGKAIAWVNAVWIH